jgi:hypothetical protein
MRGRKKKKGVETCFYVLKNLARMVCDSGAGINGALIHLDKSLFDFVTIDAASMNNWSDWICLAMYGDRIA